VLNAKNHEEEGEIIAQAGGKGKVTIATNMAGRGVDIILSGNPPDKNEAEEIKNLGGLFVLGTERHEARRIDNQLRGRSGRQGDPGESQFFVSLEDDLMRIFGSDRIKNMMGKFGIPENQPIESRLMGGAIESAQAKIEGFNFDARKYLLEYDNVLNHQRNIIYERRRKILNGDNEFIKNYLYKIFSDAEESSINELDKKRKEIGDENFFPGMKILILQAIDLLWIEHLEMMDYMRSSVRLRAYGQRDPLIEYKKEGLRLFRQLEDSFKQIIINTVSNAAINPPPVRQGGTLVDTQIGKIRRNDPCPCKSGKKYKKCCGK
jgi:preprotein translocase subunit SecA